LHWINAENFVAIAKQTGGANDTNVTHSEDADLHRVAPNDDVAATKNLMPSQFLSPDENLEGRRFRRSLESTKPGVRQ
jgi:hypothetical protein